MDQENPTYSGPRGLGDYIAVVRRRIRAERPRSFYLLIAMLVFLVVGAPLAQSMDGPRALFGFLVVHLLFFFAVMVAAIRDSRRIVQKYVTENHELFRTTVGDAAFAAELGQRIDARRNS